jgi:hypothetical protein
MATLAHFERGTFFDTGEESVLGSSTFSGSGEGGCAGVGTRKGGRVKVRACPLVIGGIKANLSGDGEATRGLHLGD